MNITTLVPPAGEPVALAAGRAFLRIDYEGEDDLVSSLLAAARARVEAETGLCLITRTLRLDLDAWPVSALASGRMALPVRPVSVLTAVANDDADYTDQFALTPGVCPVLHLETGVWPDASGTIAITLEAGFGAAPENAPDDLRLAVKLLAARAYVQREGGRASDSLPDDVAALLAPWRRVKL